MRRKVNKVGINTLTVSLPSKWVEENKVEKGDELFLDMNGSELLISTQSVKYTGKKVVIDLRNVKDIARRVFAIPYIRGYDEVKILYTNPNVIDLIENTAYFLTGFDLVEQTPEFLILRNIAKIDPDKFDETFERAFNGVLAVLNDLEKDFQIGKFDNFHSLLKYETLLNKLDFFCRRLINVHGYKDKGLSTSVYVTVQYLEVISDIVRDLIKYTDQKQFSKDKNAAKALSIIQDIIRMNHKMFKTKNIMLINNIKKLEREYMDTARKAMNDEVKSYLICLFYPVHHMGEECLVM
ncbi:hypothetical protein KY330_04970 [Candidatus Woesearchaeota archaeon]|nr:hypothetical protein [Candidatus Woesearchaeota archaeon]